MANLSCHSRLLFDAPLSTAVLLPSQTCQAKQPSEKAPIWLLTVFTPCIEYKKCEHYSHLLFKEVNYTNAENSDEKPAYDTVGVLYVLRFHSFSIIS